MKHLPLRHAALTASALLAGATLLGACGLLEDAPGRTFVHAQAFVVSGSHAQFACEKCHDPNAASFTLAGKGVDCLGCHQQAPCDTAHGAMAGYAYQCASCIQCHKDGSGGLPANHPFPTSGAHANIPCSACHGATKAKADLLCNTCHGGVAALNASHAGVGGYSSASPSCYDCHPQGTANVNHAALTPFPITHGGARTCSQCHGATKAKADLNCYTAGCHTPESITSRHGSPRPDSGACYDCHRSARGGGD